MKTLSPTLFSHFPRLDAVFTTRHGGVSHPPFNSANLAFHVGDNPDDVIKNHDLLAAQFNYNRNDLIHMRQIHSDKIIQIDPTFTFDSPPECDALITNYRNIPLMVMSADCTGILLYDPVHNAIGAIHAGRAGALDEILPKTIHAMQESFGTSKEELYIVLGPSIGGCCYEINETIALECEQKGYSKALRREKDKVFLTVNTILLQQLDALDIQQERIEVIEHCTACKNDEYFSYRADTQQTGRIAGLILLR